MVAKVGSSAIAEGEVSFETDTISTSFGVEEVTIYPSSVFGSTTFSAYILIEELTGFTTVTSLMLNIGTKSYPITSVNNNRIASVDISDTDYNEISMDANRTAIFTYVDSNGESQSLSLQFTVN